MSITGCKLEAVLIDFTVTVNLSARSCSSSEVILLSEKKEAACDKVQNREESHMAGRELNYTWKHENIRKQTLHVHDCCVAA